MSKLGLGSIVTYKDDYWVALGYNGAKVKLMAPHQSQQKLSVSKAKITLIDTPPLVSVTYGGGEFLVSTKGTIISRKSNRTVWKNPSYVRTAILQQAEVVS